MKFYREWLPLTKQLFRIMAMLADKGKFSGNLTDLCRYFSLTAQTSNRKKLAAGIEECEKLNLITVRHQGQKWDIEIIPQREDTAIEIPTEWFVKIRNRPKNGKSVAWQQVLKTFLWICANDYENLVKNAQLVTELRTSEGTICSAKAVLDYQFEAIIREIEAAKIDEDDYRYLGQHLEATAFWKEND